MARSMSAGLRRATSTTRARSGHLYRVTGKPSDADDLVQEAFCRLLQAEVGGLGDEELRRYVFRIGSNLLADRWRRATQELSWLDRLRGTSESHVDPEVRRYGVA